MSPVFPQDVILLSQVCLWVRRRRGSAEYNLHGVSAQFTSHKLVYSQVKERGHRTVGCPDEQDGGSLVSTSIKAERHRRARRHHLFVFL